MLKGWTPLIAQQVEYSPLARTVEGELAPLALDQGMALVSWSPLRNRVPARQVPARQAGHPRAQASFVGAPSDADSVVIAAPAEELGTTSDAVSLAWLRPRGHRRAPSSAPPGWSTWMTRLAGLEVRLTRNTRARWTRSA